MLGVNSYIVDGGKSIKRGFNFQVHLTIRYTTYAPYGNGVTAEPTINLNKIQDYGNHGTFMGVNSYVFHGDKSIKSSQKCGGISSVPRLPLFATFKATTEHKIIKILNYDLSAGQQTLLGVNSYNVFDDDKSIKSDSKIIKPWRVLCLRSLSTILFHFSGHCGVRSPKVSKCKCSLIELYNGNWYH